MAMQGLHDSPRVSEMTEQGCMMISESLKGLSKACMMISESPKWLSKACMMISESLK